MADESLIEKVHSLSDLELAVLLCFIGREHCLISTPSDALHDVVEELQLVATNTFGLHSVVIECTPSTSLEDFATSLLLPSSPNLQNPTAHPRNHGGGRNGSYFTAAAPGSFSARPQLYGAPTSPFPPAPHIAPVVITKNLDLAPQAVQIQALELLRTRRIFTRTSVQTAPKQFIFIPVVKAARPGDGKVTKHLNDFFFVAHWHDPEHELVNLEGREERKERKERALDGGDEGLSRDIAKGARISENEISHLTKLSQQVQVAIDVTRYQMNIISHLRMHRAVAEGITSAATKHFDHLIRYLAPLHNLDYVTPALVGLAARKIYLHRIYITTPGKERSMQWGSQLAAVRELLDGLGPEDVIEDVLGIVAAPL